MSTKLSSNDRAVLGRVFNPECPNEDNFFDAAPEIPLETNDGFSKEQLEELQRSEIEAIKLSEAGQLESALKVVTSVIDSHPNYSSAFNNRAQIHQLLGNKTAAYDDLEHAITLSKTKGKVAIQALTQRGILYMSEDKKTEAVSDLKKASDLGGSFARRLLVDMNPYAALCNQMLSQVFQNMFSPDPKSDIESIDSPAP